MKNKVSAVVVLYNPTSNVLNNIFSYLNQIEYLWIIDNSSYSNEELIFNLRSPKIKYLPQYKNIGIAAALNIAAKIAISSGYDYLLTMDQDSSTPENMVANLVKYFIGNDIAIISPSHIDLDIKNEPVKKDNISEETIVMTSGNIISLNAYKAIGGFNEELYIDYVDHDFCLRLKLNNYRVLKINNVSLFHKVGSTSIRRFFIFKVYPMNHTPVRVYYQTRNRFYLRKLYKDKFPEIFREDMMLFRNGILKILLFENFKIKKIKMLIKGYFDYRNNILGEYISR